MTKVPFFWSLILLAALLPACAHAGRKYYTDAKLAIMRSNLEKYGWARSYRAQMLAAADRWAAYDDKKLRTLVVPPEVPRCYDLHSFGCPVHGERAYDNGLYKWGISFDKPFKVVCPYGGEEYPSNDFAAFLASGMKDRSLLTGDYPDDGWGWRKEGDTANYWFVAYYAHWIMLRSLLPAISTLGTAAVMCEEDAPEAARKYAHKCALLLWQLAEYYPDYEYSKQSREGKEHNPNYTGKITNHIWEVQTPAACAPAYDATRPFLAGDAELQQLTGKSGEEIDAEIRERLLMEAARCTTDGSHRIAANYGSHQRPLLLLAAVLDEQEEHPTSAEMIEYVVANPDPKGQNDIGLRDALESLVYRDGMPQESIGYNYGWVNSLTDVAEGLLDVDVNFFRDRRFQRLITWPFDVMIAGAFVPPMGDTGNMYAHGRPLNSTVAAAALPHVRDPRMAHVLRESPGGGRDVFKEPIEDLLAQFPEQKMEPIGVKPFHFAGYGLAYLQNGSEANRTASAFFYGRYPGHAHADQLNIMLFSHGNALLTDIGYPEQTDSRNHKLSAFYTNTVAHNTVVVNARKQGRGPGKLYAYQPAGFAQFVDASCDNAYGGVVSMYRRANMLVELSPTESYLFDVFYVRGGNQHDYCALGPPSVFTADPPLGPAQQKGTLAGEDVPYEHFYDDERFAAQPLGSMAYGGYKGSGFQYLFNVRRAQLQGHAVCEWRMKAPSEEDTKYPWEGIGLRAHLIGTGEELIAADSKPQKYKSLPDTIQYMLRRRTGEDLASTFVTVYEPYKDTAFIKRASSVSLEPDDGQAAVVRIELAEGGTHYAFHSLAPEQTYTLDGKVRVAGQAACVALDAAGKLEKAMLFNGTELSIGDLKLSSGGPQRSKIASVDYAHGIVEIADPVLSKHFLPGQTIIVAPDTFADCLTVQNVIDETHFSIGDEDVRTAGGPVNGVIPDENRIVTSVSTPHTQAGMTVLNSLSQPQGRLAEDRNTILDRAGLGSLKPEDFPKAPDGSQARFSVVMAGPGDEVLIPSLVEFVRKR